MTSGVPFFTGVALGLAGAAHCAGMCGGFAARAAAGPRRTASFALYVLGKTFAYVCLGAVAGAAGSRALRAAGGAQAALGMAAGFVLVVAGVVKMLPATATGRLSAALGRTLTAPFAALLRGGVPGGPFALGAATGLLPCGLVYLAALQGAACGTPLASVALMAGFGAGTAPVLGGAGFAAGALRARLGARNLRIAGACLMIATGVLAIVRAAATALAGRPSCCS